MIDPDPPLYAAGGMKQKSGKNQLYAMALYAKSPQPCSRVWWKMREVAMQGLRPGLLTIGIVAGGMIMAGAATATPGSGFAPNPIGSGNVGTLGINTAGDKTGKWGLHLKTLSSTDISADRLVIQPGGHSGWHTHPGPILVVVTSGSVVWTNGSDPLCTSRTYTVGEAYIEEPFVVHKASNASGSGGVGAEYLAFAIKPQGVVGPAFRIDRPQPTNCAF